VVSVVLSLETGRCQDGGVMALKGGGGWSSMCQFSAARLVIGNGRGGAVTPGTHFGPHRRWGGDVVVVHQMELAADGGAQRRLILGTKKRS
jgi:hypothetical protein